MDEFRPLIRVASQRLSAEHWGAGRSLWEPELDGREVTVDQLAIDRVTPPPAVEGVFDDGVQVLARSRRYSVQDRPVMLATSYIPLPLAEGTRIVEADTGPGGVYARLAEVGRGPVRFVEKLHFRAPSEMESARLEAVSADRVGVLTRTALDAAGLPVEVSVMVFDLDAYELVYHIEA